jgi:tetratricopeptide (TPR) repeat protein
MRRGLAMGALLAAGCAAALKEPPPISELQHGATGGSAEALLEEARAAYAKRPDVEAVRRAETLCLEAAQVDEKGTDGLLCAIQAKAWLAEREKDSAARKALAVSAVQAGQWCQRRDPSSAACKYWLGVALGMQARERPTTAEDGLKRMAQLLREAMAADPGLDEAGPERILAVLLLRAPGWPVGPGDVEEGLELAQKAVKLFPDHPPNQLALGEGLQKNGKPREAREAFTRAAALARTPPKDEDPDAATWIAEADDRLRKLKD